MRETGESFVPASRIRNIPTGDTQLGFPSIRRSTEHVGTRPQGNLYRLDFFAVFVRNFHRNHPGFWLVRLFLPGTTCDARKKNRGIRNGSCGVMGDVTDCLDSRHLAPIDAPFTSLSVEATFPVTRLTRKELADVAKRRIPVVGKFRYIYRQKRSASIQLRSRRRKRVKNTTALIKTNPPQTRNQI